MSDIIVPPELPVDVSGLAIMGGFGHRSPATAPRPELPLLRVHGFAMMGGVDVSVRLPGESARDAKRREREERDLRDLSSRTAHLTAVLDEVLQGSGSR